MRKHLTTVAIVIVLAAAPSAHAGIKCWTNKDGVRECGNSVPPEYAQQETETKDKRGLTIDKSERAKTLDELEAERQRAKIDQRLAVETQKRAARDRVLLDTFSSEDDLVLNARRPDRSPRISDPADRQPHRETGKEPRSNDRSCRRSGTPR